MRERADPHRHNVQGVADPAAGVTLSRSDRLSVKRVARPAAAFTFGR
jgi:hypothetical protein